MKAVALLVIALPLAIYGQRRPARYDSALRHAKYIAEFTAAEAPVRNEQYI